MKINEERFKGLLLSGINFTDALLMSLLDDDNFDTILNCLEDMRGELENEKNKRSNWYWNTYPRDAKSSERKNKRKK